MWITASNMEQLGNLLSAIRPLEDHDFTVFTLGRICYQKNPMLFNDIARALPEIHFLWIGDGEMREELTSPNIEITGWLDRKNAPLQICVSRCIPADFFVGGATHLLA